MKDMHKLIELLDNAIRKAKFEILGSGRIGSPASGPIDHHSLKTISSIRRRNGRIGPFDKDFMMAFRTRVDDENIADLVTELHSVLNRYLHPQTDHIGNGLVMVMGGDCRPCTLHAYAKILIQGAAALGSERMVELLGGWMDGEPLRYRRNTILEGITMTGGGLDGVDIRFAEGMHLMTFPDIAKNPRPMPDALTDAFARDGLQGVVLSEECEAFPAIFNPEDTESGWPRERSDERVCKIS